MIKSDLFGTNTERTVGGLSHDCIYKLISLFRWFRTVSSYAEVFFSIYCFPNLFTFYTGYVLLVFFYTTFLFVFPPICLNKIPQTRPPQIYHGSYSRNNISQLHIIGHNCTVLQYKHNFLHRTCKEAITGVNFPVILWPGSLESCGVLW